MRRQGFNALQRRALCSVQLQVTPVAEEVCKPKQAIILAAGLGSRLRPFTEKLPKCFVPVAGKPMIFHQLESLRASGVENIVIVNGYCGEVFEEYMDQLGPGVELVSNPRFDTTEVLASLLCSEFKWDDSFYVSYSDIVYSEHVMSRLEAAPGDLCVVGDRDFKKVNTGRQGHLWADVEALVLGETGSVAALGKGKAATHDDADSEFIGLIKVAGGGKKAIEKLLTNIRDGRVPAPVDTDKLYLCDLVQMVIDQELATVTEVPIYGNWREVDTPFDLQRANNSMQYLNDQAGQRELAKQMGKALLSEANDLKRPTEILSEQLNIDPGLVNAFIAGEVELETGYDIMRAMTQTFPVPLGDLWVEPDDTHAGVRVLTKDESEATERVLTRPDKSGSRTPYYAYRDAAMSRLGPFRPEWIKELRVVEDSNPENPDVVYNNGHLMMQTTFFVGPVNFYYELRGKKYCFEANTGDSNFISPFVKHSFASRDPTQEALIIAVTYGGSVRRALQDFGRMDSVATEHLAGDARDAPGYRRAVLARHLANESLTAPEAVTCLEAQGMAPDRAAALMLDGAEADPAEVKQMAALLSVHPAELAAVPMHAHEEVSLSRSGFNGGEAGEAAEHGVQMPPARNLADGDRSMRLAPLVRTPHQPQLKTFDLAVPAEAAAGPMLQCGLHQFMYVHGSAPVGLEWGDDTTNTRTLQPGDSLYMAPAVPHRFSNADPDAAQSTDLSSGEKAEEEGRVYIVRIPGNLTSDTWAEFATFEAQGRQRVGKETMRWYN